MSLTIEIKSEINSVQKILLKRHLNKNGLAQRFMTSEIKRLSDPYVPKQSGTLKNTVTIEPNRLIYTQIYARYHWYGKVMAGNPRRVTGKAMSYNGAPMRGPKWTERMWADRGNEVVKSVANFVGGRCR